MIYSQKYTLMHFIAPLPEGAQFHMADWPLHITIADIFALAATTDDISRKLTTLLSTTKPVEVTATGESMLGTTRVILLEKTNALQRLHDDIISLLEKNGTVFNNPEFTRTGFLPHSTIQRSERLHAGDIICIDTLSLVDMFPDSDWQQRKVLKNFNLN